MRSAILKGEKTISELIGRIFRKSADTGEAEKQAADALLRANPQLANMKKVPAGTKIVVPETPLPINPAEVDTPSPSAAPAPVAVHGTLVMRQHLNDLQKAIPAGAAAAVASAKATIKLTNNAKLQAAAAKDPALAERLASISQQATTKMQQAQSLQKEFENAIGALQAHLGTLGKS